jgi:phosphoribosyl-ATP pyrophosphohydrolase/phosphoribosyl-AMP cyclohydrolase
MKQINWDKYTDGLVPCIVQHAETKDVLMLGFMNQEALVVSETIKQITFYSRTKQRLWTKGETSGNKLTLVSLDVDCDNDTILARAIPSGATCHTGAYSCFESVQETFSILTLENVIKDRIANPTAESYTNSLMRKGINKIAQKVGEEAVELVIEAKDNNEELFLGEAADLLFHYLLLLQAKGKSMGDVMEILEKRHKK